MAIVLEGNERLPPVTPLEFNVAFQKIKPSVLKAELKRYEDCM